VSKQDAGTIEGITVKTIQEAEVVVVGAGAVGCSIAYWLGKRGKDVLLVDKVGPGAGTSTVNFGLVWVSIKQPHTYMELCLRSARLWPEMVAELDEDVELRQGGGLKLCATEEEYRKHEAIIERQSRSPLFEAKMISPEEVREMQPGVQGEITGALWSPHDGDCNPVKWTHALARGCDRVGVRTITRAEVTGFELDDGNAVTGVLTDRGRIGTRTVVNAGGPWAPQLAEMVGVSLGLFPQRGQIMITERADVVCPVPMSTVRQDVHGHFWLGTTEEDVGFDLSTTEEAASKIAAFAARIIPATANLKILRHFSGLRPMPRDGLPFLGPVAHVPGYYIAVGHSGITLSPGHGKTISDLIVDGATDTPLDDYDPLRYDERGVREPGPEHAGGVL
jgi:glycine/D-amino acid oxidase-like deaminating enzyme